MSSEPSGPRPLADRTLDEPHPSRLPTDAPDRDAILDGHRAALDSDAPGYVDPRSGLFVFSAAHLADRGYCCETGCRHCPYLT